MAGQTDKAIGQDNRWKYQYFASIFEWLSCIKDTPLMNQKYIYKLVFNLETKNIGIGCQKLDLFKFIIITLTRMTHFDIVLRPD